MISKLLSRPFAILSSAGLLASAAILLLPAAVPSGVLADGSPNGFNCSITLGTSTATSTILSTQSYMPDPYLGSGANQYFGDSEIATTPSNLPSTMMGISGTGYSTGSIASPSPAGTFAAGFADETQLYQVVNNSTSGASPDGGPAAWDNAQPPPLSSSPGLPTGAVTPLGTTTPNTGAGLPYAQVYPVSGGVTNFSDPLIPGGIPTSILYESYTTNPTAWMPNSTQPNSSCGDNLYAVLDFNVSSYIGTDLKAGTEYTAYLLVRDTDISGPLANHLWYFQAPLTSPTLSTVLSASTITAGGSVHDTATLTGASSNAGGTVSYTFYTDNACTLNPVSAGTVTVTGGVVPDSMSVAFPTAGTFYWQAKYSGDSSNSSSMSSCTSETLVVTGGSGQLAATTLSTVLSASTITAGGSVHDTATLTGASSNAGGTVSYTFYTDNACTLNPVSAGTVTVTGGVVPDSMSVAFPTAGTFYWQAKYSGDSSNSSSTSSCTSETLVVNAVGGQLGASTTPTTGAELYGPGLAGALAMLLGGLLLMAGLRVSRTRAG